MKINAIAISKYINYYYILLLLGCLYVSRPDALSPLLFRLIVMIMALIPALYNRKYLIFLYPTFGGINNTSFFSIFPSQIIYYVSIIIVFSIINWKDIRIDKRILVFWAILCFLTLLHLEWQKYLTWMFIIILLSSYITKINDLKYVVISFVSVSIFLSLLFIINRDYFLVQFGLAEEGLERSGWVNPNVFGSIIGCGYVIIIGVITKNIKIGLSKFELVVFIISSFFILFVLIINASRGSLLAAIVSTLLFILISKVKLIYKILIIVLIIIFTSILYNVGIFDLFIYRMQFNVETGGGRTLIWEDKITEFYNNNNFLDYFLGIGKINCDLLGAGVGANRSTHNDIISIIISYGLIGLLGYIVMLLYPLKKALKSDKLTITVLLIFLLIESCLVEPFLRSSIVYYMLYIFIYKYAILRSKKNI